MEALLVGTHAHLASTAPRTVLFTRGSKRTRSTRKRPPSCVGPEEKYPIYSSSITKTSRHTQMLEPCEISTSSTQRSRICPSTLQKNSCTHSTKTSYWLAARASDRTTKNNTTSKDVHSCNVGCDIRCVYALTLVPHSPPSIHNFGNNHDPSDNKIQIDVPQWLVGHSWTHRSYFLRSVQTHQNPKVRPFLCQNGRGMRGAIGEWLGPMNDVCHCKLHEIVQLGLERHAKAQACLNNVLRWYTCIIVT